MDEETVTKGRGERQERHDAITCDAGKLYVALISASQMRRLDRQPLRFEDRHLRDKIAMIIILRNTCTRYVELSNKQIVTQVMV